MLNKRFRKAEIITLRAIALKLRSARTFLCGAYMSRDHNATSYSTETATRRMLVVASWCRDHNATSYSTETSKCIIEPLSPAAEIITLRAIALKRDTPMRVRVLNARRDHNATSYSTETKLLHDNADGQAYRRDHNATSYSTETSNSLEVINQSRHAEIITLRAIALKQILRALETCIRREQRS